GLPEIDVLDRLAVGGLPAVALPAREPVGHAAAHVLGVGDEIDLAGLGERRQRLDRGGQLHTVVRRAGLVARQLPHACTALEDGGPAAGPGISVAGAVGMDADPRRHREAVRLSRPRQAPPEGTIPSPLSQECMRTAPGTGGGPVATVASKVASCQASPASRALTSASSVANRPARVTYVV